MPWGQCKACGGNHAISDDGLCFSCEKDALIAALQAQLAAAERERDSKHAEYAEAVKDRIHLRHDLHTTRADLARAKGLLRQCEVALIRTHPHPGLLQASLDDGSLERLLTKVGEKAFDPEGRGRALLAIRAFLAAPPAPADTARQQAVERVIAAARAFHSKFRFKIQGEGDERVIVAVQSPGFTGKDKAALDLIDALAALDGAAPAEDRRQP